MTIRGNPSHRPGATRWSLVLCLVVIAGCISSPPRPSGVPERAVRIARSGGHDFWQFCSISTERGRDLECTVTNALGTILAQGKFVAAVGAVPETEQDLLILPEGGNNWIVLRNGAILVPEDGFQQHVEFLRRIGRIKPQ